MYQSHVRRPREYWIDPASAIGKRLRTMLAIAAVVALILGVVGIYSVIAQVATQRTREVGIRIALGAQTGEVRAMFLRRGLWLTAAGIGIGIVAAILLGRVMTALLFGVVPIDPVTYVPCR